MPRKPPPPALIGGPYSTPARCKVGRVLACLRFGDRPVAGLTDTPIPWPYSIGPGGKPLIHLTGDLVKAVKTEASKSVAYHWGVDRSTVHEWRRTLGVGRVTPGTKALLVELWPTKLSFEALSRGGKNARAKGRLKVELATKGGQRA